MKHAPRLKQAPLYANIVRNWRDIKPIITSRQAKSIWLPNMIEFANCNDDGAKFDPAIHPHKLPCDFDSGDWRYEGRRGRKPEFWNYVCYRACHWLVDLNLYVAAKWLPGFDWRIISYWNSHSTVWNGCVHYPILFDMNFLAIGISPREAWKLATKGSMRKPNQFLKSYNFKVRL